MAGGQSHAIIADGRDDFAGDCPSRHPVLRGCLSWPAGIGNPRPPEAEIVAPLGESALLYPWLIRKAHAQGRQVWVWPWLLDRPLGHRILLALGVDGIITNDPVSLRRLVGA